MPVIMGVFTLFYNAAFGLYIVAGALIALLTSPLVTMFVDMLEIDVQRTKNNLMYIINKNKIELLQFTIEKEGNNYEKY